VPTFIRRQAKVMQKQQVSTTQNETDESGR
jgi:hypothetical protein